MSFKIKIFVFILMTSPGIDAHAELMLFSVGNSLTGQLIVPNRLSELSLGEGANSLRTELHIRANSNLSSLVATPELLTDPVSTAGRYYSDVFASSNLDVLTLQPWYGASIRQEVQSAVEIVRQLHLNADNLNTRVLIYATWSANTPEDPFLSTWRRQDFTLDSQFVPAAQSFELFMDELRKSVPNAEIIPAGHVYGALADAISSGVVIPGVDSIGSLYGDSVHVSNAGAYVAGVTAYSILYGKSSEGLPYTDGFLDPIYGPVLTTDAVPIVQQISWQVSSSFVSVPEPAVSTYALGLALFCFGRRRAGSYGNAPCFV